jgi:hypothetical protein
MSSVLKNQRAKSVEADRETEFQRSLVHLKFLTRGLVEQANMLDEVAERLQGALDAKRIA